MYRKLALLMAGTMLLFAAPGICKCRHLIIYVEGSIVSPGTDGLSVKLEVTPDPNWEPQPDIEIKEGKFAGQVYFDATKKEGRVRDNCSRVPATVEVLLFKDGHEVDRVRLDVSKKFKKNELHDYKLRSPVILHVKP